MYILKDEYRILKYVKKHKVVTKSELIRIFPHFNSIWSNSIIQCYLDETNENREIFNKKQDEYDKNLFVLKNPSYVNGEIEPPKYVNDYDKITYRINRDGQEYFEKKQREFWVFILPYGITTIIAATSVILEIINFILNHCSKGAP